MRWDELFEDLAGQASAAVDGELLAEAEERSRDELARRPWNARVAVSGAGALTLDLVDGDVLTGRAVEVGDGWLCLATAAEEILVTVPAVAGIRWGTSGPGHPGSPPRTLRSGLRPVLRALVRRRVYVSVAMRGGRTTGGTFDAVGADHVELAEHPADRPRRAGEVRAVRLVPFAALLWVRYARG